jgi:Tfp pilus assembly protein PilV
MTRGLTFIEVVATLLLVTIGIIGVLGIVNYGTALSDRSQASSTAMETATTMIADDHPLGMSERQVSGGLVTGYLNGYFVRRTKVTDAIHANSNLAPATITVEVALPSSGEIVATLRTRIMEVSP